MVCIIGAGICILSTRKETNRSAFLGFGLLFIGMEMMQGPMAFKNRPDLITVFGDHIFLAFLSGLLITLFVQSSSANP